MSIYLHAGAIVFFEANSEIMRTEPSLQPTSRANYSSKMMEDRRRRVLEVTRKLISQNGHQGFSMANISKLAEVSEATLYNIYGTKDRMVAAAIKEGFDSLFIEYTRDVNPTIEKMISRLELAVNENLRFPKYSRAVVASFFSMDEDNTFRRSLIEIPSVFFERVLINIRDQGELSPRVEPSVLAREMALHQYAVLHSWTVGATSPEHLGDRLKAATMLLLSGQVTGKSGSLIDGELQRSQEALLK